MASSTRRRAATVTASVATERPASQGVLTGKLGQLTEDGFINCVLDSAFTRVETICQTCASIHTTGTSVAGVDDVLKKILIPSSHEVSVRAVSGGVTIGEDERLGALALGPAVLEERSVPVDLDEEMGYVNVACRAILVAVVVARENHVGFEVGETGIGVVAGREVDISTERRGISIAVLIGESSTGSIVVRVDHSGLCTIRTDWVGRHIVVGTRACPLDGLDGAV